MDDLSSTFQLHKNDGDILLRTALPTDATLISNYFIKNREHLRGWEPKREAAFFTVQGWAQKLVKLHELHKMGLGYYCLITDAKTEEMLGTISFSNLSRFPFHACNVGYSLDADAQGRGIMRKSLKMACDYMFDVQNMHRIMAGYMPRNQRSEAVLQQLGFTREGFAKDYLLINGKWEDHNLMSLINPNWRAE